MPTEPEETPYGRVYSSYLARRGKRWTLPKKRIVAIVNGLPERFHANDAIDATADCDFGRATVYRILRELTLAELLELDGDHYVKRGFAWSRF